MKALLAALFAIPLSLAAQGPGAAPPIESLFGDAVLVPNQNLVADGLPLMPATIADDVRRYTGFRGVSSAVWHPQRRELLISTRFGNTNQLHMVRVPGGDRRQITFFDDPVDGGSFDPAGRFVVFGRDVGGNQLTQLYRLDLADGRVTLLTDGGRSQNGSVQWNRAGDRIAYSSTRRNGTDRDIYVMNPADPASSRLVLQVSGRGWKVTDWSPDGTRLVVLESRSDTDSRMWLVEVASGRRTLLTPQGSDTVAYTGAEFALDGRGLFVTANRGREYTPLFYFDFAANAFSPLTTDLAWDVDGFQVSPDGKRVAFKTNEAGISRVYVLEMATRQHLALSGLPEGVIGTLAWHPNNRDLAFTVSSPQSPPDAYSVDVESGELTRWTESEMGGLAGAELAVPTLIRWKSFDGLELTAFYHKPPARFTGPRPVIINIHGGGPAGQSRPAFLGRANYFLNELGVAIISPDVRGSAGHGKTFAKLDNGTKRADAVKDVGSLLDWIARQPELDASKVLVSGGSSAYVTIAVIADYQDRIRAAMTLGMASETQEQSPDPLDAVSISSALTLLQNSPSFRPDLRRVGSGDARDSSMRAFLDGPGLLSDARKMNAASASASSGLANMSASMSKGAVVTPLFVVQGANDPSALPTESAQMVELAKQNGGPVWYLMSKDEGHGFQKKSNVDFMFYAAVMFVREYLLDQAAP